LQEHTHSLVSHPNVHKVSDEVIICPSCNREKFCSSLCLSQGETAYHSETCKATGGPKLLLGVLENLCALHSTLNPLLVARMYAKFSRELKDGKLELKEISNKMVLCGESWDFIGNLEKGSRDDLDEDRVKKEFKVISDLFGNQSQLAPILNLEFYENLLLICQRNAAFLRVQIEVFTESQPIVTESKFPTHGVFLPFIGSFFNHSCNPNVSLATIYNYETSYIAQTSISKGTELTVTYVDSTIPLHDRRDLLLDTWKFWCECPKCLMEDGIV